VRLFFPRTVFFLTSNISGVVCDPKKNYFLYSTLTPRCIPLGAEDEYFCFCFGLIIILIPEDVCRFEPSTFEDDGIGCSLFFSYLFFVI